MVGEKSAFTVAEDASSALQEDQGVEPTNDEGVSEGTGDRKQQHTSQVVIDGLRTSIVGALARKHGPLVKKSRALYWSADKTIRAVVTVSKRYGDEGYWFAYHSGWDQFLGEASLGFFVLGCIGLEDAFAIPFSWIHARREQLNFTERNGERYWHILLYPAGNGQFTLRLRNRQNELLDEFGVNVGEVGVAKGVTL